MRLTYAVLLTAAVTASALTVPVAATAAPAVVVQVAVASSTNSATSKSAVATCPDTHPYVYSAGGQINGGAGLVTLTDAHPQSDLHSVIAWGHENGSYSGWWSVSAYATCGQTAVQLVTASTGSTTATSKSVDSKCPAPKALYGVGWEMTGAFGAALPTAVRPNDTLTGLTVEAQTGPSSAISWALIAHAICGPRPVGLNRPTATGADAYEGPLNVLAPACSGARYGVGGEVVGSPYASSGTFAISKIGSAEPGSTGEVLGWWWYWLFHQVTYSICAP